MGHRHRRAIDPEPKREQRKAKKSSTAAAAGDRSFHPHALFGNIPLIPVSRVLADGKVWHGRDYDPDYVPPMPSGAVRGDVRKQQFCRMCHVPKYFYVDIARRCVECGADFVFAAAEQKYWFEQLKFHFDSIPVRCADCRRKRRSENALTLELAAARKRLQETPETPAALLALAEAVVRYRQRTGRGNLNDALGAARKARRLLKDHSPAELAETYFWEAASQALSGRLERARSLYATAMDHARGKRRDSLRQSWKSFGADPDPRG